MDKRKLIKKLYTLVCFDKEGVEVERFEGITEDEAWTRERDYARVSVFESGVVSPKVRCDVPDCERIAVAVIKLERSGPTLNVCRYHSAGVWLTFKEIPIKGKLKYRGTVIAPNWLCVKYCPSYQKGECRAFKRPLSAKERRKKEKGYTVCGKRMTVLCIQDEWWAFIAGVSDVESLEDLHI